MQLLDHVVDRRARPRARETVLPRRDGRARRSRGVRRATRDRLRRAQCARHAAGIAAGGTDAGAPGLRPRYHAHYYAAFLRDPEGNAIEFVTHTGDDESI